MAEQASAIENLLNQLLLPDNEVIQKATEELKKVSAEPTFLPALCVVLTSSSSSQVRQYAAVLLRRKISKRRQWHSLADEIKNGLKESIFEILLKEEQSAVRNSLAQLIGTLAGHCDDINEWPQLLAFLERFVKSETPQERQIAMLVMKTVSSEASDNLQPLLGTVLDLCSHTLHDDNLTVPYYSILVLNNMVYEVSTTEMKQFSDLIPRVLEVIQALALHDEVEIPANENPEYCAVKSVEIIGVAAKCLPQYQGLDIVASTDSALQYYREEACSAMELFDSLVECEVPILHPHVKTIVDFCLTLAATDAAPNSIRVKSLECISWLVSMKKKAIQKMNMIQPILDVVFSLMCHCDDDEEDLEDSEETEKAASYAARIMDSLALHLPPEKIVTHVVKNSSQALLSEKPSERKAGYVALGIIAEGCSDHITSKYLQEFLERVIKGFDDPHSGVRNGAMFALGQFSEHLQPGITKYSNEIIPLLVNYAIKVRESPNPSLATMTRTYYALEAYVENLEKDVFPFLPELMAHLISLLDNADTSELSMKLKEFSFSCIASIACAAKTNLNPYFDQIMAHFKVYLSGFDSDEMKEIQLQALETLSSMAREMDESTFTQEICNMCVNLGLSLINQFNDPDVRRCVYSLLSSLSTLKTTEMVSQLPVIVNYMLESLRSTEGVKVHYDQEEAGGGLLAQFEADDTAAEDDDDDDYAGISIENAYLEEKEDACTALSDLALQYYEDFMPYIEDCYQETLKLVDYGSSDVTKSSLKALANFAIAVHDYNVKMADEPSGVALKAMLAELTPRFLDIVVTDKDRSLAMTALHCIQEMLDSIGEQVLAVSDDTFTSVISAIKDVLRGKTACQDEEEEDDDEEQAEYDTFLLEYAAGTLPLLAKITGSQVFTPYLKEFMPHLLKKCKGHCSTTERSYSVGTIAECLDMMGGDSGAPYVSQLTPIFTRGATDADDELRNNSIFALGVLVTTSAGALAYKYGEILQMFHELVKSEKSARVRDNICASTARILSAGHTQLPVAEVYGLLIDLLPITQDLGEYETVCQCFVDTMYTNYKPMIVQSLPQLFMIMTDALQTDKLSTATSEKLALMVKDVKDTEPERFQTAMSGIPQESALWNLFPDGL